MNADLVLEGGGVKGIGLVGAVQAIEDAGYEFPRIAGTSAGAIVGALVAAGYTAKELHDVMLSIHYPAFRDEDFLDHLGLVGKGLSILFDKGIYQGDHLKTWLRDRLAERNVHTFADLRLPTDPHSSLPPERRYKLVVIASDISRGALVHLPWDYARYGLDPDAQPVADAVRASMSIPFFYEPVKLKNAATAKDDYLVDGGMLSNFPVDTFDRTDGKPPRWPTFGIKLSAKPDANQVPNKVDGVLGFAKALVATMTNFHDQMYLDQPAVVARTIFVDTMKVSATNFDIDAATQASLYTNGVRAGDDFVKTWDFADYVKKFRTG